MPQGILSWKQVQFTIFLFVLANEEPRGAWKMLADTGLGGGKTKQPARSADRIVAPKTRLEIMRCVLYKIRTFFENNPDAEI